MISFDENTKVKKQSFVNHLQLEMNKITPIQVVFSYLQDTQQIYHVISNQCLDCDRDRHEIFMNPCDKTSETQMWKVEHVHEDEVRKEWDAKQTTLCMRVEKSTIGFLRKKS